MQLFLAAAYRHPYEDPDDFEIVCAADANSAFELYFDCMCEGWDDGADDVRARYGAIRIWRIPPVQREEGIMYLGEDWPEGCPLLIDRTL